MKKRITNNPNGRPKGIPNKSTAEIREMIKVFISQNLNDLQQHYNGLDADRKLLFFDKMLKHVLPAVGNVDVTSNGATLNAQTVIRVISNGIPLVSSENDVIL